MKFLINLLAPAALSGYFESVQKFLDGKKTYIGASIALLQGLAGILAQICAMHGIGDLVTWLQAVQSNTNVLEIAAAIATIGAAHKLDKNTAATQPVAIATPVVAPIAPNDTPKP